MGPRTERTSHDKLQNTDGRIAELHRPPLGGQWNHFEIKLEKGLVTVHLNGELVLDNFECTFTKPAGPLVLQHHGTPLWFKNIYLKELK
ncbi:MAG: DUF1080 domain-containing protein [Thermoguttaceae bacterium]